jgi:hypothetical protein
MTIETNQGGGYEAAHEHLIAGIGKGNLSEI